MVKKQKFRASVVELMGRESADSVVEGAGDVERDDLIATALTKLSATQRVVIELSYFLDLSTQEIAEIAGCPVNTVKTRLFHARRKIRSFVEQQEQRGWST